MPQPDAPGDAGVRLVSATAAADIATIRELFREYATELGVDLCFQGFAAELAGLPGTYAPPRGCLLLAVRDDLAIGCVGLRPVGPEIGEMKRLHVRRHARRQGVGRALAVSVIDQARACSYRAIRLDTLEFMTPAIELYESLGFRRIAPYYPNPIAGALYFELTLA